jgi:hypothetical protein
VGTFTVFNIIDLCSNKFRGSKYLLIQVIISLFLLLNCLKYSTKTLDSIVAASASMSIEKYLLLLKRVGMTEVRVTDVKG